MKMWYGVSCGTFGRYGMFCPIERKRALSLLKRHAGGFWRMVGQRRYFLDVCPMEVSFAFRHGADSVFELIIGKL